MPNDYKMFQKYYDMDRFNKILSDVLSEMNRTTGDEQYSKLSLGSLDSKKERKNYGSI